MSEEISYLSNSNISVKVDDIKGHKRHIYRFNDYYKKHPWHGYIIQLTDKEKDIDIIIQIQPHDCQDNLTVLEAQVVGKNIDLEDTTNKFMLEKISRIK